LNVKTVQGMLRHANSQTTSDIYTQEVGANSLTAQGMVMSSVMKPASETVQWLFYGVSPGEEFSTAPKQLLNH